MKQIFFFIILMQSYNSLKAQESQTGIRFEQSLAWEEVLSKAKAENKYIFLDCIATWCGPCKAMDKNVYTSPKLGEVINSKFLAIQMQMDTSKLDNEYIKRRYNDAKRIMKEYKIIAYPSLLFFSPDGELVAREVGYKDADAFITIANDVVDTLKHYKVLLQKYRQGTMDTSLFSKLALMAHSMGDINLANSIAEDYKNHHLNKLSIEELCTKENLEFINQFSSIIYSDGSKGEVFHLFYNQPDKVDRTINWKGFAEYYVKAVITKEEIYGRLYLNGTRLSKPLVENPDWKKIYLTISTKYGPRYAESTITPAQLDFYKQTRQWEKFAEIYDTKLQKTPPKSGTGVDGDPWALNSEAWDVFLNCTNKKVLLKALKWSELSIKLETTPAISVQYFDTKANLLYKLGRIEDAIVWERRAIKLDSSLARERGEDRGGFYDEYNRNINKMKNGEPTWKTK